MIPSISDPRLAALPGIRYGFFTREGGVSGGIYTSLNCGTGSNDDRAAVAENRRRVAESLGADASQLASMYQIHSTDVVTVDAVWPPDQRPKADAAVTNRPGIVLGVGSADCGPILFADAEARVIGAAHAGWRGTLAGVAETTIAAMEKLGAQRGRIVATLGPTISQANYEVGGDFRDKFLTANAAYGEFFIPSTKAGHFMFDLPGFIVSRLRAAGVDGDAVHLCTYADPERFFSYRRTTHRGEPDYGRLLSGIVLAE